MAIKLSQKDLGNAKSWLFDVFLEGGLLSSAKASSSPRPSVYDRVVGRASRSGLNRVTALNYCKNICAEIRDRQFKNLDTELTQLAEVKFQSQLGSGGYIKRSPEYLAAYIAQFCKANDIYWDTEIRSHQEVEEFERTLLGAALKEYGCFTNSEDTPASSTSTKTAAPSRRVSPVGTPGQPPKNDYKSSGGQSQNVRDLKGTPGNKIIKTSTMYRIEGVNANSPKTPYVFIRPLKASGAVGNTNKVFVGDPSGYTDCTLFFDDHVAADKVLVFCTNTNAIPANISGLHVSKVAPDRNGYYEVGTEFGNAFIKASKLNEDLDEAEIDKESESTVDYTAFAENLMKE